MYIVLLYSTRDEKFSDWRTRRRHRYIIIMSRGIIISLYRYTLLLAYTDMNFIFFCHSIIEHIILFIIWKLVESNAPLLLFASDLHVHRSFTNLTPNILLLYNNNNDNNTIFRGVHTFVVSRFQPPLL